MKRMRCFSTIAALVLALITAYSFAGQRAATHFGQSPHTASSPEALPTVRGQEAVRLLKQENLHDSLTAAYQAAVYRVERNQHHALPGQSQWHASNPAWEMSAGFAGDAVHIGAVQSGGVNRAIALRLTGYGYDGRLQAPAPAEITANGNRVEYHRGALSEWYVNDPTGLEQGFTLTQRPTIRTGGPLVLTMAVDTELQMRFDNDSEQIQFVDPSDRVWFQYANLKAWDATGRELPAKMQLRSDQIALVIDDIGAAYPLTIDPLIFTETKLTAFDAAAGDSFGHSVAISGDTAVAGASGADTPGGLNAGSAYVFVRAGGVWSPQAKLTASDAAAGDLFGHSVAISGDTVVVGAPGDELEAGSAYVFVRGGDLWSPQVKLTASDAAAGDAFGLSVAISGDTAVVGAPHDDIPFGLSEGSAYVFGRTGLAWNEEAKLTASDAAVGDFFGSSVAIGGAALVTAVVGAPFDDTPAGLDAGSVYLFVRDGGVWSQQQKRTAIDAEPGDTFGLSVAISGDTVVVGAPRDDTPAGLDAGSAYVFTQFFAAAQQKLVASDAEAVDLFGWSVAISGDTVVAGTPRTVNSVEAGSAYVFVRTGFAWNEEAKLTASDGAMGDIFGLSIAISDDTVVAGAPGDDTPIGTSVGSAYVYVNTTVADVLISLAQNTTSVKQGDTLTYTMTVKNFGPNRAINTVINDTLSSGTTFVTARASKGFFTAPPAGQTGTVTWYLGDLLPTGEEAAQIQVTVTIRGKSTITNTATVQSNTPDPNLVNNTASITTTVAPGKGGNGKN